MPIINDPTHMQARLAFSSEEAARWKKIHEAAFAQLPVGTSVIVDLSTGEYVTASTWHEAEDAFKQRFGTEERLSHSFTVGRPIFVGGGLWQK